MNILVNASNLKQGGGVQVADSFCRTLDRFPEHRFVVVLSSVFDSTVKFISGFPNVKCVSYSIENNKFMDIISGRDAFMDGLCKNEGIDVVISIFGPIYWKPFCRHLVGFARAQLIGSDSPYWKFLSPVALLKENLRNAAVKYFFARSADRFYTENESVTQKIKKLFKTDEVITATNTYNQVFEIPALETSCDLPPFNGVSLLTLSSDYPFKNLKLIPRVAKLLRRYHPEFKFRFVVSTPRSCLGEISEDIADNILCLGPVHISQCPSLYRQCQIEFQPTVLECFTATYPEAMVMGVPIVTSDMAFAHSLCGDAALYFDPLSEDDAARIIWELASSEELNDKLVAEGKKQLSKYDTYLSRARKIIEYAVKP